MSEVGFVKQLGVELDSKSESVLALIYCTLFSHFGNVTSLFTLSHSALPGKHLLHGGVEHPL